MSETMSETPGYLGEIEGEIDEVVPARVASLDEGISMVQELQRQKAVQEFDSENWREERNAKLLTWLGDQDAIDWFLDYCHVCELFDDFIDRDRPITDENITKTLYKLLVGMPLNPFFDRFKGQLCPLITTGINGWLDANELERSKLIDDRIRAFTLRDRYMEVLAFIIVLARGWDFLREHSQDIRTFFSHSETFSEYDADLKPP